MKVLKPSKVRTEADRAALSQAVGEIIENVRANGDAALIDYNTRFDQCERQLLRVSREEIEAAYAQVTEDELADIRKAAANIEAFAEAEGIDSAMLNAEIAEYEFTGVLNPGQIRDKITTPMPLLKKKSLVGRIADFIKSHVDKFSN